MRNITPRRPGLKFASAPIHWAQHPEFTAIMNSQSPIAPHLEPYLNRVMEQIRDRLSPSDPLVSELNLFIQQESNHYIMHARYNKHLYRLYPALQDAERALEADYRRFLEVKSLQLNAAYCAGFETIATFQAKFYFERATDLFAGADADVAGLFLWHFAEEFEHRSVAHDAFKSVSRNYFLRLFGALWAFVHLGRHAAVFRKIILDKERESMSPDERAASLKREKGYMLRQARYVLPRMLQVFLPFYDPARQKAPDSLFAALERYKTPERIPASTN